MLSKSNPHMKIPAALMALIAILSAAYLWEEELFLLAIFIILVFVIFPICLILASWSGMVYYQKRNIPARIIDCWKLIGLFAFGLSVAGTYGYARHELHVRSVRAFVVEAAAKFDGYHAKTGHFPDTPLQVAGPLPDWIFHPDDCSVEERGFTFRYWDPWDQGQLYYEYTSQHRSWIRVSAFCECGS